MPFSKFDMPRKRTVKPFHAAHDHDNNNSKGHKKELERKCKESIISLQLFPEEYLAEAESFKGVDWLKEETPWPSEAQRRVHRYMHHHNLYQVTNLDDPLFVDLVDLVKSESGVPNTRNWEQKVPGKCRALIETSTSAWKKDGLLVVRNNVTTKCDTFQYFWHCAIQAAQASYAASHPMERAVPRAGLGDATSSVDGGLMTVNAGASEDCYSRKRAAESVQESPSLGSVKRVCQDQLQKRVSEAFTDVDNEDLREIGSASHLASGISRSPKSPSTAAISMGSCHRGDTTPGTLVKESESAVLTAREALSALHSAENGSRAPHLENEEFGRDKEYPHLVAEADRCQEPIDSPDQDTGRIKFVSWHPTNSNGTSSGALQFVSANENSTRAALNIPTNPPKKQYSDEYMKASLPTLEQSSDTGIKDQDLLSQGNERHAESSSSHPRMDSSPKTPISTTRTGHFGAYNTAQACQSEREYSTIYGTSGLSQGHNLPNLQAEPANCIQSGSAEKPVVEISNSEDSDVASEQQYSSTSSEASDEIEYLPQMSHQPAHHDLSQSCKNNPRSPESLNGNIPMAPQTLSYGQGNQSPCLRTESTGLRLSCPPPIAVPVQATAPPQTASSPGPHDQSLFPGGNPCRDVAGFPNNQAPKASQFSHQSLTNQHQIPQSSSSQNSYTVYQQPIPFYQQSRHQPPTSYLSQRPPPPPFSSNQNQDTQGPPLPLPEAPPLSLYQNPQGPPLPPPPSQNRLDLPPPTTLGPSASSLNQSQGSSRPPPSQIQWRPDGPPLGPGPSLNQDQGPPRPPHPLHFLPQYQPRYGPTPPHLVTQKQDPPPPVPNQDLDSSHIHSTPTQPQGKPSVTRPYPPTHYHGFPLPVPTQDQSSPSLFTSVQNQGPPPPPMQDQHHPPPPPPPPSSTQLLCLPGPIDGPYKALPPAPPPLQLSHFQSSSRLPSSLSQNDTHLDPSTRWQRSQLLPQNQQQFPSIDRQHYPQYFSSSSPSGSQPPPSLPQALKDQPVHMPPDQSRRPPETHFSTSNTVPRGQLSIEARSQAWQKFVQIAKVIVPLDMHVNTSTISSIPEKHVSSPMGALIAKTITECFQWFSDITKTGPHAMLRFEIRDLAGPLKPIIIVSQTDPGKFDVMKRIAWTYFLGNVSEDGEVAAAAFEIMITPCSMREGSVSQDIQQQPHSLYGVNSSNGLLGQHSPEPSPSRDNPNTTATPQNNMTSQLGRPPRIDLASERPLVDAKCPADTIHRYEHVSTQSPHSRPFDPALNSANLNTSNASVQISGSQSPPASVPTDGEVQHASLVQDSSTHQPQPPNSKIPSAKITIRLQVDGFGRLSRSYDKSVLNSKVTNTKFFDWFAQETGHTGSRKLKFDFKDALPSKSSIIERDNEDHFDLMIHDIKRKFNHAKAYTPDLNEFGILVTDPMWDSGDEDEDESSHEL